MTQEITTEVKNALNAFETFKTDLAPKLGKLDAFDAEKISRMEKSIGDAMELAQKAESKAKAAEDAQKAADDLAKEFGTKYAALEGKQELLEAAFNRPAAVQADEKAQEKSIERKTSEMFRDFLRKGGEERRDFADFAQGAIKGDEAKEMAFKTMSVNSDPDGGFLVVPQLLGTIQTRIYETSPMRQLANVITISTDSVEYALDNDEAEARWAGETEPRPETATPKLGKLTIPVNEIYAQPKATQKIIDDAVVDIEAWLAEKVAQAMARKENTAFMVGSGVNQPRGLLTFNAGADINQRQIEQVNSGDAAKFTYDGLVNLQTALKEDYQGNASFLVNRKGFGSLLLIKDANGTPIFNMAYDARVGLQRSILGSPLLFASDMPEVGANALAAAYGDFKRAYLIVDRTGIRVLRDPFTDKPFVKFYTTKRVGGDVVNFEAVKLLRVAA